MNPIKKRLNDGAFLAGGWAELASPDVAEIMVHNGWDIIVIDGEHGIGEIEDWVAVARAVEAAGGQVLLRVPEGSETVLKRVLDRGFRSLIVPMVNSAAQAKAIASYCRYPSRGTRGYAAPLVRASAFGARTAYALEESHEELLLFVQCEHPNAVAELPQIAATPGIDGIFLGPNDLSGALGHLERLDHADTLAAFAEVERCARLAGTRLATIRGINRGWADLKRLGYSLVVGVNDVSFIAQASRHAAEARDAELSGA